MPSVADPGAPPAAEELAAFRVTVLAHGRELYRDLPWRRTRDPYAIWISEVMLQQTQVSRVDGRWQHWLELFPTVDALAAADSADVLDEWQGRALSLWRAAQEALGRRVAACHLTRLRSRRFPVWARQRPRASARLPLTCPACISRQTCAPCFSTSSFPARRAFLMRGWCPSCARPARKMPATPLMTRAPGTTLFSTTGRTSRQPFPTLRVGRARTCGSRASRALTDRSGPKSCAFFSLTEPIRAAAWTLMLFAWSFRARSAQRVEEVWTYRMPRRYWRNSRERVFVIITVTFGAPDATMGTACEGRWDTASWPNVSPKEGEGEEQ